MRVQILIQGVEYKIVEIDSPTGMVWSQLDEIIRWDRQQGLIAPDANNFSFVPLD